MVMPIGIGESDTMFQASPFNLPRFIEDCEESYGVSPRPHWITTYYGGHVSIFLYFIPLLLFYLSSAKVIFYNKNIVYINLKIVVLIKQKKK